MQHYFNWLLSANIPLRSICLPPPPFLKFSFRLVHVHVGWQRYTMYEQKFTFTTMHVLLYFIVGSCCYTIYTTVFWFLDTMFLFVHPNHRNKIQILYCLPTCMPFPWYYWKFDNVWIILSGCTHTHRVYWKSLVDFV